MEEFEFALPAGIGTGWVLPEEDDDEDDLWLKWPADELIQVRIVSPEPNNYKGHWVPAVKAYRRCTAPRCPYCPLPVAEQPPGRAVASEVRWRHLVAVELPRGAQRIWEFSPKVAKRLQTLTGFAVGENGQPTRTRPLRGLVLTLGREGRRKNGEVWCELHEDQNGPPLPEPLDVAGYLAQTWRRAAIKDGKGAASDLMR